jgi:tripartite-type tricarboxylate transporter receptor subunit TctC
LILVNSASAFRSLSDLLSAARAKPGEVTVAGSGTGGVIHLAFEMLKRAANVNTTYVPYPGAAPAVNALLGEHVIALITGISNVSEHLAAGKLRALATTSPTRIESLSGVPTVPESGYVNYEVDQWYGLFAPARTPSKTVSQLADWFSAALRTSDVKATLLVQGLNPVGTCGAEFGAYVRRQYEGYGRLIREANIRTD